MRRPTLPLSVREFFADTFYVASYVMMGVVFGVAGAAVILYALFCLLLKTGVI